MSHAANMIAPGYLRAAIRQAAMFLLPSLAFALLASAAPAELQTPAGPPTPSANTADAPVPANASLENTPIVSRTAPSPSSAAPAASPALFNPWRILGSLAVVLGSIFVFRWAGRRFLGLPAAASASGAIRVLCRSILTPKQQLMLVQVGRRVVLVADSGSQMNALCEITDPDEVAALAGQIHHPKHDSMSSAFLSFLHRAEKPYLPPDATHQLDQTPSAESDTPVSGDDLPPSAFDSTREELTGLLKKVRTLSRHFRRP